MIPQLTTGLLIVALLLVNELAFSQIRVKIGAEKLLDSIALLKQKKIALVVNHTSRFPNGVHLVDTLRKRSISIQCIFAPEHGYQGNIEGGKLIAHERDPQTGIAVYSLYGKQKRPSAEQLRGVNVVIFDIQDVGVRCYTYLTTLVYVMQACAENKIPLWILDRPNPNCHYIGGPLLKKGFESFVGVHAIPLVYGLTLGEYALMAKQEKWIDETLELRIFTMEGYRRSMQWEETGLPWPIPSPNLREPKAALLYPILCWYEGTQISVARGTDFPFLAMGFPFHTPIKKLLEKKQDSSFKMPGGLKVQTIAFRPKRIKNVAENPPYLEKTCYGYKLEPLARGDSLFLDGILLLKEFFEIYMQEKNKHSHLPNFFNSFFGLLVGNEEFQKMIEQGTRAEDIFQKWKAANREYEKIKMKYHIYPS
ncbi:MAG: DUF1343 domain-containing protein [Bacteroidia bacterium]|nr:DUF1343 domain-containing protein [Bacteroidia bacterium]MDW8158607.1 DUF1343 domain-containing protein [Bacteroidia bacterium]